jgi:hypothetical protein
VSSAEWLISTSGKIIRPADAMIAPAADDAHAAAA